mmetsp:Transcript_17941/g.62984  ORF Transcript_17941/g.62984 Transcript_17941/m.62984 type:complete len:276 (+) Transcript_17941:1544-2371(+)
MSSNGVSHKSTIKIMKASTSQDKRTLLTGDSTPQSALPPSLGESKRATSFWTFASVFVALLSAEVVGCTECTDMMEAKLLVTPTILVLAYVCKTSNDIELELNVDSNMPRAPRALGEQHAPPSRLSSSSKAPLVPEPERDAGAAEPSSSSEITTSSASSGGGAAAAVSAAAAVGPSPGSPSQLPVNFTDLSAWHSASDVARRSLQRCNSSRAAVKSVRRADTSLSCSATACLISAANAVSSAPCAPEPAARLFIAGIVCCGEAGVAGSPSCANTA